MNKHLKKNCNSIIFIREYIDPERTDVALSKVLRLVRECSETGYQADN